MMHLMHGTQMEPGSVRQIAVRGYRVPSAQLVEGAEFECWYANEETWYKATVESTTDRATAIVK